MFYFIVTVFVVLVGKLTPKIFRNKLFSGAVIRPSAKEIYSDIATVDIDITHR